MKIKVNPGLIAVILLFGSFAQAQTLTPKNMKQVLIDKIVVPKNVIPELMERLNYNTQFLAKQPGLLENSHYERTDEQGNLVIVTVAVWESSKYVELAKIAVQQDYQRQKINLPEKLKEWGVTMDRGLYQVREK